MDNVGIVVEDLDAAVAFFTELGMELEGKAQIEGLWADRTVGLDGVRSDIAMMRTPATSAAPRASSSPWPNRSANGPVMADLRPTRQQSARSSPQSLPICEPPHRGRRTGVLELKDEPRHPPSGEPTERRGLISPRPYNNRHNDAAGAREDHLG
jgi:catechol 2,3-dioxygenase-like lactoylglutathione lyase family enzyme